MRVHFSKKPLLQLARKEPEYADMGRIPKNIFLALGFTLPHQQMFAPQKFFDMYPLEDIVPAQNTYHPNHSTHYDYRSDGEIIIKKHFTSKNEISCR